MENDSAYQFPLSLPPRPAGELNARRIYAQTSREVKQTAALAFKSYFAAMRDGDAELAQAALERYLDASHVLRTGAPRP